MQGLGCQISFDSYPLPSETCALGYVLGFMWFRSLLLPVPQTSPVINCPASFSLVPFNYCLHMDAVFLLLRQLRKRSFSKSEPAFSGMNFHKPGRTGSACFSWSKSNSPKTAVQLCLEGCCSRHPFRHPGRRPGFRYRHKHQEGPSEEGSSEKKFNRNPVSSTTHIMQPSSSKNTVAIQALGFVWRFPGPTMEAALACCLAPHSFFFPQNISWLFFQRA